MKKALFFLLAAPMVISCSKPEMKEAPCTMVTVEVTSQTKSTVAIEEFSAESFEGIYKKSFTIKDRVIDVRLNSEQPSVKSIKIYLNGEEVVRRNGDCEMTNYDLTYNIDNF